MDSDGKEARESVRIHFLFLMKNMHFSLTLLCFLYSYKEPIIDRLFMEDYMASIPSKRNFDLLMRISKTGKKGLKALIEGLLFSNQKHIADVLDLEISTDFYDKRKTYFPRF